MMNFEIFRDKTVATLLVEKIKKAAIEPVTLMEVCGGHTMAIHRFGIPSLLPENVKLISGPGCPVCVTGIEFVDQAVALSEDRTNIILTYGDMMRVPGTSSSLEAQRSLGADIRIINSPLEALKVAYDNPEKRIIFLGVGFETTSPATAISILEADNRGLSNFFLLSAHKIMPPALRALADEESLFDGLIAPGHVSTITGTEIYDFLVEDFSISCVISGFEPIDILQSIYMLIGQKISKKAEVEIQYKRAVKPEGNLKAKEAINKVFKEGDVRWRGLGIIPGSGLVLQEEYKKFDALLNIELPPFESREPEGCKCGEVMKGIINPADCPLFGTLCTPAYPVGACMVSSEGSCHAHFRYKIR
jgi:hydrogenase expression/formation protein HypD